MSPLQESARFAVLARYGAAVAGLRWVALGSAGGFSGAHIWRGDDPTGVPVLALKAWPPGGMTADRLTQIHGWMARAAHLPFVPAVLWTAGVPPAFLSSSRAGGTPAVQRAEPSHTVVSEAGRVWDLTRWMPGVADFHADPTPTRLTNACTALAQLHRAWKPPAPGVAPCPAVARRLRLLAEWRNLQSQLASLSVNHAELQSAFRSGVETLSRLALPAERALLPWANRPVAVQPCLCDIWHDHVLFTGDNVSGVIDFGAMKEDHVAVDIARLLGDLVANDDEAFSAGLRAYQNAGRPLDLPAEFVRLLDRTGAVCAVGFWLLQLADGRPLPDPAAVAARLGQLTTRLADFRTL